MTTKYKSSGDVITITASGAVASNEVVKQGSIVGVAQAAAASGDSVALVLKGVFTLAKETGTGWTAGDLLYWDDDNSRFTKTADGNTVAGWAAADAASGAATGDVLLVPSTEMAQAAYVATISTANGTDLTTTEALANQLKTTVNAILAALQAAGLMAAS